MKLQYLYDNNNNIKYSIKAFSIFGLICISLIVLVILFTQKIIDKYLIVMIVASIVIPVIFINVLILLIGNFANKYKRKQLEDIKDKGTYVEGVILSAYCVWNSVRMHGWLLKSSGCISVSANNKIYTIADIDYNEEFKNLEKEIKDNFNNKIGYHIKEIKIGIYLLDNKAIADFNTMKL